MPIPEIHILAPIGAGMFDDGVTAKSVVSAMPKDAPEILVRINSPGGDVYEGIAIYSALKNCGARVKVRIEGIAASAASLIAMAGDEIEICDGAFMLIHEPYGDAMGTSDELQSVSEDLARMRDSFIAIYAKRTGQSAEQVAALMKEDRLLTAQEAVDFGFADLISAGAAAIEMSTIPRKLRAMVAAKKGNRSMAKAEDETKDDTKEMKATIARLEAQVADMAKKMADDDEPDGDESDDESKTAAKASDDGSDEDDADKSARAEGDESDDEKDDAPPKSRAAKAKARGFKAGVAYAREVNDLCALANRHGMAAEFIRKGVGVADVRKALLKANADASNASRIMTAHNMHSQTSDAEASKGWDSALSRLPTGKARAAR